MKFVHLLTVPLSLAALTVMGGADGCMASSGPEPCQPLTQQVQFVGYEGCQNIVFCASGTRVPSEADPSDRDMTDTYAPRFGGNGYDLDLGSYLPPDLGPDKRIFLNAWLYIKQDSAATSAGKPGQLCAQPPMPELVSAGASTDTAITFAFNIVKVEGGGWVDTYPHTLNVAVRTLDFAPEVSNATHQVQLGDRKVAVFVQPTAVTELKLQANLTQTPAAGTISYQLPEMPATMTTVPAANTEAIVSVSEGIAVGEGATVKATLEADGETIEREAEVRVVARADDPILIVRPVDASNCAGLACAGNGGGTHYSGACFSTAESLPSSNGTPGPISWGQPTVVTQEGAAIPTASAKAILDNVRSSILLCYTDDIGVVRLRATARAGSESVSYDYLFDTASR